MATCQDILNATRDRECLEEFLRFLPEDVKAILSTATDALSAIAQAEAVLSAGVDEVIMSFIDQLDEQLAAMLLLFNPLFKAIDQIQQILLPFTPCFAVGQLLALTVGPIVKVQNFLLSASNRKALMSDAISKGSSKVVQWTLDEFTDTSISGVTQNIQDAQDYLEGIRACIGAVGSINIPPGTPADEIGDLIEIDDFDL